MDELADVDSAGRRPADAVDVIALGVATAVTVLATTSLLLAHLGAHSWWAAVLLTAALLIPVAVAYRSALRAEIGRAHV